MLDFPEHLREVMRERCLADYPQEACGLLIGARVESRRVVNRVFPARNVAEDRRERRFVLDPAGLIEAEASTRRGRNEILGFYHSHPDRTAEPSAEDLSTAQLGWSHVIVAVCLDGEGRRVTDERSWQLTASGAGFEPEEMT